MPEDTSLFRMTIWVDADATPRDALESVDRLASGQPIRVYTVSSVNHEYHRPNHITVDPHPQAVDMEILSRLQRSEPTLVITQDYGLAALALGKGAKVLSTRGVEFTEDNIDLFLFERDLHQRERRMRTRHSGPKPRGKDDAQHFADSLQRLIESMLAT